MKFVVLHSEKTRIKFAWPQGTMDKLHTKKEVTSCWKELRD